MTRSGSGAGRTRRDVLAAGVAQGTATAEAETPPAAGRVLIINQLSPSYPVMSERCGRQTQLLVRHFSPDTTLISETDYSASLASRFDYVVVVGNDAISPFPSGMLEDLARFEQPILWLGYGLEQLPVDTDLKFGLVADFITDVDLPTQVEYQGRRYPVLLESYTRIVVTLPSVRILASFVGADEDVPYIVRGANLWYVNGRPNLDSPYLDETTDAPTLILADILHDFFATPNTRDNRSIIRLEDVSVHIDPDIIRGATDILRGRGIPFVIGLIPNQRFEDGTIVSLRERPEFVESLRYAVENGATIALHGYHHTFGSGEDYEFWDEDRNEPIMGESWDLYADKVEHGIRILRDSGLEPRLWETPHYTASPLAYEVFSHYFSHAIENREPASWLPYPIVLDEYGQSLIPENMGYINPVEGRTVGAQLQRARQLLIVRDSWATGFYHPASIPLDELEAMADGLRELGYAPADIGSLPFIVRYDYQPPHPSPIAEAYSDVAQELGWLSELRRTFVQTLLFVGLMSVFLVRLRTQWQPTATGTSSLVEVTGETGTVRRGRRGVRPATLFVAGAAIAVTILGAWIVDRGDPDTLGPRPPLAAGGVVRNDVAALAGSPAPEQLATPASPEGDNVAEWVTSDGWEISIYYTAVESLHTGPSQQVVGCTEIECVAGNAVLGDYPQDFVQAVKDEGTGRITSGSYAGRYLNWSIDVGYWLDTQPRDARGFILRPYLSAAADSEIPYVTSIKVLDCGVDKQNGSPIDAEVCSRMVAAQWVVRDRFPVGSVGKHLDFYIGEEDHPAFVETSPNAVHTVGATVSTGQSPLSSDKVTAS